MTFAYDSLAVNAKGGTELMKFGLESRLDKDLLNNFQIFISRVEEEMDPTKVRILWCQDLPGDPASDHLKNDGHEKFHKIVFATNWQMQGFINMYGIPWSKCTVLANCIEPVAAHEKPNDGKIRMAYWSTPHRGLNILVPVFKRLCETHDNIELDVYSSFEIYGWGERDAQFQELFQECKDHPNINYHGSIANGDLKKALEKTHILAYPSIWTETSCITLMEAMSAGMLCVHPNLGALYETAAGWTHMYQWDEDLNRHASLFHQQLDVGIRYFWDEQIQSRTATAKAYADSFYSWDIRANQWEALLQSLVDVDRSLPRPASEFFSYKG